MQTSIPTVDGAAFELVNVCETVLDLRYVIAPS